MKNKNNQFESKVKKIIWNFLKPFLPFLIIVLFIFSCLSTMVDAIYIQFVQNDDEYLSQEEFEIKKMCISKAEYLNTCNNFINNESTNNLLDVNSRENDKLLNWSHLYSILTFHNMANDEKMTQKLLDDIGENFISTFKYIPDIIKTEQRSVDEQGNVTVTAVSEETQYLLVECDTIVGHFTYTYKDFVEENENTRITKKVFVSENLIGEEYERLSKYLKKEFKLRDDDLENQIEIVIQSSTGYFDSTENTEWFLNKNTSIRKGSTTMSDVSNTIQGTNNFIWPIPGYTNITSPFGMRKHPITGVYKLHTGTDVGAPLGADFVAMADGVVITACMNTAYGNMVMISHGNGIVSLYAHGSKILVKTNDIVKQGQAVLKVGSTGYSTGPHAHFEIRINNEYIDPMQYFRGGI